MAQIYEVTETAKLVSVCLREAIIVTYLSELSLSVRPRSVSLEFPGGDEFPGISFASDLLRVGFESELGEKRKWVSSENIKTPQLVLP